MFRDGIFENFGDFLDKINESILHEHVDEIVHSIVDILNNQGYSVDEVALYDYIELLPKDDFEYLRSVLSSEDEEGVMDILRSVDLKHPDLNLEVKESKLQEQNRKEAEQTEQPKEETPKEDAERLGMEDWGDTDKEGKPKRKDKVDYPSKLYEPTEKELSQEVKYERKSDPLYLCNECCKTFRANKPICKCGSKVVERISKVDETEEVEVPHVRMNTGMGTMHYVDCPKCGSSQLIGPEIELGRAVCKKCGEPFRLGKEVEHEEYLKSKNPPKVEPSESIKDKKVEESDIPFYKYVFSVQYKLDGKESEERVEAFDEVDAEKYLKRIKPRAEVLSAKKIGESKLNEQDVESLKARKLGIEQKMLDAEKKYQDEQNRMGSEVDALNKRIQTVQGQKEE